MNFLINPLLAYLLVLRGVDAVMGGLAELPPARPKLLPAHMPESAKYRHLAVFGQTGTGKSRFIEALVMVEVLRSLKGLRAGGHGAQRSICLIDPHGDLFRSVRARLAIASQHFPELLERVVLIDPENTEWTVRYDPLAMTQGKLPEERAAMLTDVLTTLFKDDPTTVVHMKRVATNTILALILAQESITSAPRFLRDRAFRNLILARVTDEDVLEYWHKEFPQHDRDAKQAAASTLNRLEPLVRHPRVRDLLTPPATINFRDLIDRGAIILVNAPKVLLGETASYLLCGLILAELQAAALSRYDIPENLRVPCSLYCDEFVNYATDTLRQVIAESRRFRLELCLAGQEVKGQLRDERLLSAVLNTVGNLVAFRLGYDDADALVRDIFNPELTQVKHERTVYQHVDGFTTPQKIYNFRSLDEIWELERRRITTLPDGVVWWRNRAEVQPHLVKIRPVYDVKDLPDADLLPLLLRQLDDQSRYHFGRSRPLKIVPEPSAPSNFYDEGDPIPPDADDL